MANLTCPFPSNINPLSPNGFIFNITKLPNVNFFCQQINLPGLNLPSIIQGTPFSDAEIPGEKLTYDTLDLQFLVDEQMLNYTSVHNWITALGFPQNYDQYINFINNQYKTNVYNIEYLIESNIPFGQFISGSSVSSPNYPAASYPKKAYDPIIIPILQT